MEETKNKNKEQEAAPDSWETADLEESVNRLFISSQKSSSPSRDSDTPPPPPPPPPGAASLSPVSPSEEAIAQVDQFLREALEKPRERISVLRMEQDIERLIRNPSQMQIEFTALPTSYLRLAAHRLAQHYSLQSIAIPDPVTLDGSGPGSRIIIRKINTDCRLPAVRLADIPVNLPQEDTSSLPVKLAIKPRNHRNAHSGLSGSSSRSNFQKSVEERKEEYNRARARIFSNSSSNDANSSGSVTVSVLHEEPRLPDSLDNCGFVEPDLDEAYELANIVNSSSSVNLNSAANRGGNGSGSGSGSRNRGDKEGGITRSRSGGARVAIFRDRDIDRKDPDYDRSYDRYVKRFDPGFGFNCGSYPMQPLYVPAVNYSTEFPQLGSAPRPPHQLSIDTQQQALSVCPRMHGGPWSVALPPPQQVGQLTMPYHPSAPHEAMIAHAYNATSPISAGGSPGVRTPVYIHSPQYSMPGRPGMPVSYVSSHEHIQSFLQAQPQQQQQQQQQQQEGSYAFARPR